MTKRVEIIDGQIVVITVLPAQVSPDLGRVVLKGFEYASVQSDSTSAHLSGGCRRVNPKFLEVN
jgi:hypothetical protein